MTRNQIENTLLRLGLMTCGCNATSEEKSAMMREIVELIKHFGFDKE